MTLYILQFGKADRALPILQIVYLYINIFTYKIIPKHFFKNNKHLKRNIYNNQFKFITGFEIYNTLVFLSNPTIVFINISNKYRIINFFINLYLTTFQVANHVNPIILVQDVFVAK